MLFRSGRAGRRRRAVFPTGPQLCKPPHTFSRCSSSPTSEKATRPDRPPGARHLPDVLPPFLPIRRRTGGGEAQERAGRGETTVQLSERTTLKILPQVQLRKPCLADLSIKTMTTERKDDLTEDSHDIL